MNSNIEEYLATQRRKLSARKAELSSQIQQVKEPVQQFIEDSSAGMFHNNKAKSNICNNKSGKRDTADINIDNVKSASDIDLSQAVDLNTKFPEVSSTTSLKLEQSPFGFYDDIVKKESTNIAFVRGSGNNLSENLSKAAKDIANQKEIGNRNGSERSSAISRKSQGDMDQWVSDTFYSYFPSFNQEEQRRDNLVRDRQLEYQNYLKQTSDEASKTEKASEDKKIQNNKHSTKSYKTDVEIIVNNPPHHTDDNDRENVKRPGSTRDKLLQDLMHTDLSNILNSNAVQERNKRSTELEQKKKKEYQHELLRQIEDKRREIQILKEKEKKEEELLAKKLEEQLKAMKLNEDLEKEKKRIEKARLESEQDKAIQLHLLSQLESDYKSQSANGNKESTNREDNKVYKYFSNSARYYENGRYGGQDIFESFESDDHQLPLTRNFTELKSKSAQNECPHLNQSICTFCNIKLKNYESWCKQCQKQVLDDGAENRSLLCENCQDQYMICAACEKQNTLCNFCRRKRNICLYCISNYCIHCGKSIRDANTVGITRSYKSSISGNRSKPSSERSFQILEVSHPESEDNFDENDFIDSGRHRIDRKLPFSMNIDKKSIFHPDNKIKEPKIEVHVNNGELAVNSFWKARDYDEIKEQTSNRLNKYLSNYGDLAAGKSKSKNSQTKNIPSPKLNQDEYPMMPLLREMPKKKYTAERKKTTEKSRNDRISTLSRKWEIPAVQRLTISNSSPKVLTQVGAFRKQLQAEEFELDD